MKTTSINMMLGLAVGLTACSPARNGADEDSALGSASDTEGADAGGEPDSSTESGGASDTDGDDDTAGDSDGDPAEVCAELTFDNPLDEALCESVQGLGIEPTRADDVELCRRTFLDLKGISPTQNDYELHCKNLDMAALVEEFMASEEYVRLSQRVWADTFHFNSEVTYYQYIADLDALVGSLHRGEVTVRQFVEEAVTHPAFLGRWDGQDLVAFNFMAHLRRDANPAERIEVFPLFRMWGERAVADPFQSDAMRVVLDTNNCQNQAQCTTDFWQPGDSVIVPQPVPGATDPEQNVIDQAMLTPDQWNTVRLPGRRLAEQGGLYEAYVDLAIERYLGYDLGTQVPAGRQALVDLLEEAGGDVRVVDRTILTSLAYTATNTYDEEIKPNPEEWDPPYWHGPVKQVGAEEWLASAQRLVGLDVGYCDHRYPEVQSGSSGFHPHDYPSMDGTTPDYDFRDQARLLGGCPDRLSTFRETRAGLVAALTQATLTKELCESSTPGSPIYPIQFVEDPADKSEEALSAAGNQIYGAALIRGVPASASDALSAGIDGCRSTTECDPQQFAFHTCRLVLKSADFLFY
jgi:hypothetical protein